MTQSTEPDPDRELVEKAQAELPYGTNAFDKLVRKHSPHVYARAYRILRSSSDAEEATQDVFLAVFRNVRRFRFDNPFGHWLNTVTLNSCRMILRKRASEQRRRDSVVQNSVPDEPDLPPDMALRELLNELLDVLEPGTRVAIVMRFIEGHSFPEIAQELDLTESAVKMRVSRGAKRLRELYEIRANNPKKRLKSERHPMIRDEVSDEQVAEDLLAVLRDEEHDPPSDLPERTIRRVQAGLTARDLIDLTTIVFVLRFCAPLLDLVAAFLGGVISDDEGRNNDE